MKSWQFTETSAGNVDIPNAVSHIVSWDKCLPGVTGMHHYGLMKSHMTRLAHCLVDIETL